MSECCIKSMLIKYAFTVSTHMHKNQETENVHMHTYPPKTTPPPPIPPKKKKKKKKSANTKKQKPHWCV